MCLYPLAWALQIFGRWWQAVLEIKCALWLFHDSRLNTLEPVIPPTKCFLQEANGRVRDGEVGVLMHPGA